MLSALSPDPQASLSDIFQTDNLLDRQALAAMCRNSS
jgi:hypothetical protein